MNKITSNYRSLCETRLAELSRPDLSSLARFAERRLVAMGLSPSSGEDVAQQAIAAVLSGLESGHGGRVPRLGNLQNADEFMNYLRGVISSLVWNMTRTAEFRTRHVGSDLLTLTPDPSVPDPAFQADFDDLEERLFGILSSRAPARLQPTIIAWRQVFSYSDRIPAVSQRKYAHQVRVLAREILAELGRFSSSRADTCGDPSCEIRK